MRSVTTVGRRRGNRARHIFGVVVLVGGKCSREVQRLTSSRIHQQCPRPHCRSANHPTQSYRESRKLIILGGRRTPRPKLQWLKQLTAQGRDGHPQPPHDVIASLKPLPIA